MGLINYNTHRTNTSLSETGCYMDNHIDRQASMNYDYDRPTKNIEPISAIEASFTIWFDANTFECICGITRFTLLHYIDCSDQ